MTTFTIHRDPRHNCHFVNLAAMLKRADIDIRSVFTQAGLYYKDDSSKTDPAMFILYPYYREIIDHLRLHLGIIWNEHLLDDPNEYLSWIRRILTEERKTVGVTADVFELTYCPYYQINHELHEFEIIGCDESGFEVCDHYYQYFGFLKSDELEGVFRRSLSSLSADALRLYFMQTEKSWLIPSARDEWRRILTENCKAMDGELPYELKFIEPIRDGIVGMNVIGELKRKISEIFNMPQNETTDLVLEHMYKQIREVGNSRYHFCTYLRSREEEAAMRVFEAEQCWMITANLMIRASLTYDFGAIEPRIHARLNQAAEAEAYYLAYLRKQLDSVE